MRNKGRRGETSALDKIEFKMPIEFPGELIGEERYLAGVMGYESPTDSMWVKPDHLQRICMKSKEEDSVGPCHRREEQRKRTL